VNISWKGIDMKLKKSACARINGRKEIRSDSEKINRGRHVLNCEGNI
jgi:hypothetical protein